MKESYKSSISLYCTSYCITAETCRSITVIIYYCAELFASSPYRVIINFLFPKIENDGVLQGFEDNEFIVRWFLNILFNNKISNTLLHLYYKKKRFFRNFLEKPGSASTPPPPTTTNTSLQVRPLNNDFDVFCTKFSRRARAVNKNTQ